MNVVYTPSAQRPVSLRRVVVLSGGLLLLGPVICGATGAIEIGATRTVTDALGREVEIPEHPQRIVTAGRAVLMIANALYLFPGAAERIVGIGRIDQGQGNFLAAIDPEYGRKASFERNVGAEQIVGVNPDLVMLKSELRRGVGSDLERLGIPVVYVDLETPEQYQRDLRLLGAVLGQPERGESLAQYYERETERIVEAVSRADERPRTLFLYADLAGAERVFNVPPTGWIQTTMVELAGGDPVWADAAPGGGWSRVGLEQIASWDPDVIVLVAYRQDVEAIRDSLAVNPTWASLTAVRNGELHAFPLDYYSWDQPDVRWILGLKWLASTLHPRLVSDNDIRSAIYEFFIFAYDMSRQEIDAVVFANLRGVAP